MTRKLANIIGSVLLLGCIPNDPGIVTAKNFIPAYWETYWNSDANCHTTTTVVWDPYNEEWDTETTEECYGDWDIRYVPDNWTLDIRTETKVYTRSVNRALYEDCDIGEKYTGEVCIKQ